MIDVLLYMMKSKKFLLMLVFLFLSIGFVAPMVSQAVDSPKKSVSGYSIIVRIRERIEYFFAFSADKKIEVLEKQAENRLNTAQDYAEDGNNQQVQGLLQNYLQTKEKQNTLLDKVTDTKEILETVEERTIEQQKTMEQIKTKVDEGAKQQVIQVQEKVVNQVAKRVIDVNGSEGATEFLNKVEHVWAPGTGPGGEAGVVVVGGEMRFAQGISTIDSDGGTTVEDGNSDMAPGTIPGGSGGNTVESGGVDPGTSSEGSETGVIDP